MLIGFEKRFLFVASTKTASTSLEQVLRPHTDIVRAGTAQRKHIALRDIVPTYDFLFSQPGYQPESFFKFGVMRDPLDWIRSWYRYRLGNKVESPLPEGMSFAEFWARQDWNILQGDGRKNLQRDMFVDYDGQVLADVIIPYDRLDGMFHEICTAFGIPRNLPRANVSRIQEIEHLPAGLEEEIRDFYAEDYALYAELDAINAEGMSRLRSGQGAFRPVRERAEAVPLAKAPERHVFVFSYCSEAGAAVQSVLNDLPGYCIRGENNDTVLHLMRAQRAIATDPRYGAEQVRPWDYGRALAQVFAEKVLSPPEGARVAGCRSTLIPDKTAILDRYVTFLSEHFDNAQILFVTRRHVDVAGEGSNDPERFENIDRFYRTYHDEHPDRCHMIDYDRWVSDPQCRSDLFAFLDKD